MFRFIKKQLQIFKAIIKSILSRMEGEISAFMMHGFFGCKIPSNMFLHNKATSFDIPITFAKRMRTVKNNHIAILKFFSTFPVPMFFSRKFTFERFAQFPFCIFSKMFSFHGRWFADMHCFFSNTTTFRATAINLYSLPITFTRTIFSSIFSAKTNIKFLATNFTYFFNHTLSMPDILYMSSKNMFAVPDVLPTR